MKLQNTKLGFTLIELLVVITIIGILATGAVSVYTSQIQKARDSTRITDIGALRWWIEQFYQDKGEYPTGGATGTFSGVVVYVSMPSDPKTTQASGRSIFDYLYNVSADSNTIINQEYEVSTNFEQSGNITEKAAKDWWDDDDRLEQGIRLNNPDHKTKASVKVLIGVIKYTCIIPTTWLSAACSLDNPMLIRK